MLINRAYQGAQTRQPVVLPKSNRVEPWNYHRAPDKKRNEPERLFRRPKAFRRVFSRFGKHDIVFLGFLNVALVIEALRERQHAPDR